MRILSDNEITSVPAAGETVGQRWLPGGIVFGDGLAGRRPLLIIHIILGWLHIGTHGEVRES